MAERDATDFLYGLDEIAKHLGIGKRQAQHRVAQGQIPVFKMGRMICALKSSIAAALREASRGDRTNA